MTYLNLRSYGVDGQFGLEEDPAEFIAKLVTLFRDLRTALHPTGQCFVNISDTRSDDRQWLGIPHRLVFALQADGWRWEDEVIWAKLNPMPGSQTNRFTRSHEMVFMLNKSRDAFFDAEAVKEPQNGPIRTRGFSDGNGGRALAMGVKPSGNEKPGMVWADTGTRAKRTVWSIPTQPSHLAHFAAYPEALVRPMIEAGSSAAGICGDCGAPYQRITEQEFEPKTPKEISGRPWLANSEGIVLGREKTPNNGLSREDKTVNVTTGWAATCTCSAGPPIPALVLDPFAGVSTTAVVCVALGRRYIGFELNPAYVEMGEERIRKVQPQLTGLVY